MSTRTANANPVTAIAPLAILPIELVAQSWSCSVDAVIAGGIDRGGITLEGSLDPFRRCAAPRAEKTSTPRGRRRGGYAGEEISA